MNAQDGICGICGHPCHRAGDGWCRDRGHWFERFLIWLGFSVEPCGCPACECTRCMVRGVMNELSP